MRSGGANYKHIGTSNFFGPTILDNSQINLHITEVVS